MSFTEFAGEGPDHITVQIFATDLIQKAIERARAGLWSACGAANAESTSRLDACARTEMIERDRRDEAHG
jgi:hypothetical protein